MNQQNEASGNENNIGQLLQGLGLCEDYWKMTKVLKHSDVDRRQCRLLLQKSFVEDHILPYRSDAGQCRSPDGVPIAVWDADESRQFELRLKKWPSTDSYVLTENWIPDFVDRKGLRVGDMVGLAYHGSGSVLYFKHLN